MQTKLLARPLAKVYFGLRHVEPLKARWPRDYYTAPVAIIQTDDLETVFRNTQLPIYEALESSQKDDILNFTACRSTSVGDVVVVDYAGDFNRSPYLGPDGGSVFAAYRCESRSWSLIGSSNLSAVGIG